LIRNKAELDEAKGKGEIAMQDNNQQSRKDIVVDFLKLVVAGRIDEGYRKHVAMNGKHHNQYCTAGFPALKQAMIDNHAEYPDKRIDLKRVIAEGDMVATHSLVSLNRGAYLPFRGRQDRGVLGRRTADTG